MTVSCSVTSFRTQEIQDVFTSMESSFYVSVFQTISGFLDRKTPLLFQAWLTSAGRKSFLILSEGSFCILKGFFAA